MNGDDFKKKFKQKILIFQFKRFYNFNKYICKMYKLYNDIQLKIVENQDLL